jgi:hypothetical protein
MVHDALYQFLRAESPITRRQADEAFLRLLVESEWAAVRLFGWLVWSATNAKRQWRGTGLRAQDFLGTSTAPNREHP